MTHVIKWIFIGMAIFLATPYMGFLQIMALIYWKKRYLKAAGNIIESIFIAFDI